MEGKEYMDLNEEDFLDDNLKPISSQLSGQKLKQLDKICEDIAEIINYFNGGYYGDLPNNSDEVEWSDVIQWLKIAMAINNVHLNFTKYDSSALYCENIWGRNKIAIE